MSYNISLSDLTVTLKDEDGNDYHPLVNVPKHREGGTYAISGTDVADMDVTYNYSEYFNFRLLNGICAEYSIALLDHAVRRLGTVKDSDYWASTPGNAGYACNVLLGWARICPHGIWRVV